MRTMSFNNKDVMSSYRRSRVAGASYFFTVVTHQRAPLFLLQQFRKSLRHAMQQVMLQYPFTIDAMVMLPDHLHCIWTLPTGDMSYSRRWSVIKRLVSQEVSNLEHGSGNMTGIRHCHEHSASRIQRRESSIWQRRFWEHQIRDDRDFENHVNYCYWNHVKHGYVQRVIDWPYSTFHRDVKKGLFPLDWGISDTELFDEECFGE